MTNEFGEYLQVSPHIEDSNIIKKLSRHLAVAGWSAEYQKSLDNASILIVGAGGLGSTLSLELSGSTYSNSGITILDPDVVDESNLHRQLAFSEKDVGLFKAERLAEMCRNRNRGCNVKAVVDAIDSRNSVGYFLRHDIIFDCTDNVTARITISDAWVVTKRTKLVISASCVGWCGQVVSLIPSNPFCLRCIYGDPGDLSGCDRLGQCAIQGVIGPVVSAIASIQLIELFNHLRMPRDSSKLLILDFRTSLEKHMIEIPPSCSECTERRSVPFADPSKLSLTDDQITEISREDFLRFLKDERCIVIDARERNHFDCSHIVGSINIPASESFYSNVDVRTNYDLVKMLDGNTHAVVVVCRRGFDSLKMVQYLKPEWPKQVFYSLAGGLCNLGVDIL
jgi:molybdopterin/thiamine biosynthesis adenylyltransferase/rhodanese-related sulfurtransferase